LAIFYLQIITKAINIRKIAILFFRQDSVFNTMGRFDGIPDYAAPAQRKAKCHFYNLPILNYPVKKTNVQK